VFWCSIVAIYATILILDPPRDDPPTDDTMRRSGVATTHSTLEFRGWNISLRLLAAINTGSTPSFFVRDASSTLRTDLIIAMFMDKILWNNWLLNVDFILFERARMGYTAIGTTVFLPKFFDDNFIGAFGTFTLHWGLKSIYNDLKVRNKVELYIETSKSCYAV
jgi:hypothetical protein